MKPESWQQGCPRTPSGWHVFVKSGAPRKEVGYEQRVTPYRRRPCGLVADVKQRIALERKEAESPAVRAGRVT